MERNNTIEDLMSDYEREYILNYFGYDTISKYCRFIDNKIIYVYGLLKYDDLTDRLYIEIPEIESILRDKKINDLLNESEIEDKRPIRRCNHRNCGCDISDKRSNAKFCSRSCKDKEGVYQRREEKRFNEEQDRINKLIEQVKEVNIESLELYNKIYSK
jgi:hypothetical protein